MPLVGFLAGSGEGARDPLILLETIQEISRGEPKATPAVAFATNLSTNVTTPKHWRLGRVRLGNRRRPHPGAPNQPPLVIGRSGVACARRLLGRTLPTQWRRREPRWRAALLFPILIFSVTNLWKTWGKIERLFYFWKIKTPKRLPGKRFS